MHVFDFDKTLTNKDTLFGFYKRVGKGDPWFGPKRLVLLISSVLYKLRLISNTTLKRIGVNLFLKGVSRSRISEVAEGYAKEIQLNDIYSKHYQECPRDERCIISASLVEYLSFVFPGEMVYGSELEFSGEVVAGLKTNMYRKEKLNCVKRMGFHNIKTLFTDSYADSYLMDIALTVCLVRNGEIIKMSSKNL